MTHWRQRPKPKNARPLEDVLRERNERRAAAMAACVAQLEGTLGPDAVTHDLVAERTGVPVQYVQWKYPSHRTLVALASSAGR
jgi:DNA-binding transcriptional regulator YbjK